MDSLSTNAAPPLEASPPLHRVLVASALDDAGRRAVARAARLPLAPGARLEVLHVRPPWSSDRRAAAGTAAHRALEESLAEAGRAARAAGHPDLQLAASVVEGWPAREIVRAAWRARAELVVVGRPAFRFDGSPRATVARILRWAELPVLVVRREPHQEYRRPLCAVNRTITATETIALAARLAPERPLTLFHAYHVPFEAWLGRDAPALEAAALEFLRDLAREVGGARVDRALVRRGDPCAQIVRAATAEAADLVVLGTRGRAGLARALSASAAAWVLARAPADVAIARRHGLALPRG